ncbi:hypothetical protein WJX73_005656 [Symbiochloris irregularis]|uniref:CHRD domain-containing protein n=1 Tax=Symbiochloris irregularis TaxID=706552 RepID=A0AAW1PB34_9CHLO
MGFAREPQASNRKLYFSPDHLHQFRMKRFEAVATALALLLAFAAQSTQGQASPYTAQAFLSNAGNQPASTNKATGSCIIGLNSKTNPTALTFQVSVNSGATNLGQVHIHRGNKFSNTDAGNANGTPPSNPPLFILTTIGGATSGQLTAFDSGAPADIRNQPLSAFINLISAGNTYCDIHAPGTTGGNSRGPSQVWGLLTRTSN